MKSARSFAFACVAALSSACVITPEPVSMSPSAESSAPNVTVTPPAEEPVLYARDGRPIAASGPERFSPAPELPAHGVQRGEQSRMYLLELYQETIDEKEALELEVRAMTADLTLVRQEALSFQQELATARTEIEALRAERDRQHEELRALTSRLLTAQIRRLESDKLLLEAKIDWARTRQVIESKAREASGGDR